MLNGEFSKILIEEARSYRNSELVHIILPKVLGQEIDDALVTKLLSPFLERVVKRINEKELNQRLLNDFSYFVPNAVELVRRNKHMNKASGSGLLDKEHADAILVAFINIAYLPGDLGLYTHYLQPDT